MSPTADDTTPPTEPPTAPPTEPPTGPPTEPPTASTGATTTPARPARLGWVRALIAVASIVAVLAATTTWVKRQALDTDNWVAASDEVLADPDVRAALAQFIVNELYQAVDVEAELAGLMPEDFEGLAGPVSAALRQPAVEAVDYLLGTSQVQTLWSDANRRAHALLVAVLEDDLAVVSTADGAVTLELGPLVRQLGEQLGLSSDVLDRIPDDAGNIVIAESGELDTAQQAVALTRALSVWLLVVVVGLYALAVYLAGDRRRALRSVGWALLASSLVLLLVRRLTLAYVLSLVDDPGNEAPVRAVFFIASALLAQIAWAGVAYAVVLVLGAVYAGPSRAATSVRRALAPVATADPIVVWGGALAVFGVLVLWSPTAAFDAWWSVLVLLALFLTGIEALRRQARAEFPDAEWDHLSDRLTEGARSAWASVTGLWSPSSPGGSTPADRAGGSRVEHLERLAQLHRSGALSDDEFAEAKRGVLDPAAGATDPG